MNATETGAAKANGAGARARPRLAVFKFASCDGCQLSLLDAEDELLAVTDAVEIAYFVEASRHADPGPYDIALVEGSISTPEQLRQIKEVRRQARVLIAIGACATAGGIQALRNWQKVDDTIRMVYAHPEYIETLDTSSPISDHVQVDFELRGCPINKHQLLEVIIALLVGRLPRLPTYSVCVECKRRGVTCVMVAQGIACMGPVTQAGCGAICPAYARGCYGCYGPMEAPNGPALGHQFEQLGLDAPDIVRLFRSFNGYADPFRLISDKYEEVAP
ncbi:MAG TPA: oxidoreductase [Anaerolineae bacterium]|nr:oxidoreductase [Anaerolineae bacterium]HNU05735.1 oxidoreductase [Anaerolineae bacterium]